LVRYSQVKLKIIVSGRGTILFIKETAPMLEDARKPFHGLGKHSDGLNANPARNAVLDYITLLHFLSKQRLAAPAVPG
jgi:hypothetical protein